MDLCRICLSKTLYKQLSEIKSVADGNTAYGTQMFLTCMNVEPAMDNHQLCVNCYEQLISFYSFKVLAIRNNHYFESKLKHNLDHDYDNIKIEENMIKLEVLEDSDSKETSEYLNFPNCDEVVLFNETNNLSYEVDSNGETLYNTNLVKNEELLSMVKNDESDHLDDIKESSPFVRKKRGRPKLSELKLKEPKIKEPKIKVPKLKQIRKNKRKMCSICGKIVAQLKYHLDSHLPVTERHKIQCKQCPRTFLTYTARNHHTKVKHLGQKDHCNICNRDFVNLRAHMAVKHNTKKLNFVCSVCDKRFISKTVLADHMNIHTNTKPYECDECGNAFRVKALLISHIKLVHLKIKPHLCQYCPKSFFATEQLRIHLRTHTKEKPFPCKDCGKYFRTISQRNVHQQRHTKIKNFICHFCDMAFYNTSARKTHMYTHTKERNHKCTYCEKTFTRSDHRKRHEKSAHEKEVLQ